MRLREARTSRQCPDYLISTFIHPSAQVSNYTNAEHIIISTNNARHGWRASEPHFFMLG